MASVVDLDGCATEVTVELPLPGGWPQEGWVQLTASVANRTLKDSNIGVSALNFIGHSQGQASPWTVLVPTGVPLTLQAFEFRGYIAETTGLPLPDAFLA